MILFWFVAFSATAVAQSAEEDDAQTVFKKFFGGIEVSCETLLIAEYEGDEFLGQGKPELLLLIWSSAQGNWQAPSSQHFYSHYLITWH
jgi:hypothetical protein